MTIDESELEDGFFEEDEDGEMSEISLGDELEDSDLFIDEEE